MAEPNRHEWTKEFTNIGSAELLGKEKQEDDAEYDIYNGVLVQVVKLRQFLQPFNSRRDGDRWRNDTVRQQRSTPDHRRDHQPLFAGARAQIKRRYRPHPGYRPAIP